MSRKVGNGIRITEKIQITFLLLIQKT